MNKQAFDPICPVCDQRVFAFDTSFAVKGVTLHSKCVRCTLCQNRLTSLDGSNLTNVNGQQRTFDIVCSRSSCVHAAQRREREARKRLWSSEIKDTQHTHKSKSVNENQTAQQQVWSLNVPIHRQRLRPYRACHSAFVQQQAVSKRSLTGLARSLLVHLCSFATLAELGTLARTSRWLHTFVHAPVNDRSLFFHRVIALPADSKLRVLDWLSVLRVQTHAHVECARCGTLFPLKHLPCREGARHCIDNREHMWTVIYVQWKRAREAAVCRPIPKWIGDYFADQDLKSWE